MFFCGFGSSPLQDWEKLCGEQLPIFIGGGLILWI